jgi:hypothetical protein
VHRRVSSKYDRHCQTVEVLTIDFQIAPHAAFDYKSKLLVERNCRHVIDAHMKLDTCEALRSRCGQSRSHESGADSSAAMSLDDAHPERTRMPHNFAMVRCHIAPSNNIPLNNSYKLWIAARDICADKFSRRFDRRRIEECKIAAFTGHRPEGCVEAFDVLRCYRNDAG